MLARSSIGAINPSIICSGQNAGKDVPALLEDFWLCLAENISPPNPLLLSFPFISSDKMMAIWSSMYGARMDPKVIISSNWLSKDGKYYVSTRRVRYIINDGTIGSTG